MLKCTYHDPWNSRRNSPSQHCKSVLGNCVRRSLLLMLSSRSYHAGFKQDTLKHNIVLSQIEKDLGPNLLCHFKSPLNRVVSIKKNLRFNNRHKAIILHIRQYITTKGHQIWKQCIPFKPLRQMLTESENSSLSENLCKIIIYKSSLLYF